MLRKVIILKYRLRKYLSDRRAAVTPMMVFLLIPLCGLMALAGEVTFWTMTQRALQNAADSAALAAAANNDFTNTDTDSGGATRFRYQTEALSVAKAYGLTSGTANVTVTATREAPCINPSTEPACYRVRIRRDVPLYLAGMVGYGGDVTNSGRISKIVMSEAVAKAPSSSLNACIIGLGGSGTSIDIAGSATGFDTCDLVSNSEVKCSSVNVGTIYATSVQACGGETFSPLTTTYPDPNAAMDWTNLINRTCAASGTAMTSGRDWSTPFVACSATNAKLTADVNITTANSVIVVVGQTLDLNGFNLSTSGSGTATIIFTASGAGVNVPIWFTNGDNKKVGSVSIAAPTAAAAPFRNFAIIGDPTRTNTTSPTLGNYKHGQVEYNMNILGVVYAPNTAITSDGNVVSDLNSYTCISIIAKSFSANGSKLTANPISECTAAGIDPPNVPFGRPALVR